MTDEYWERNYKRICIELMQHWTRISASENQKVLEMLAQHELNGNESLQTYLREKLGAYMDPRGRLMEDVRNERAFRRATSL
jgi:hypothetical protein